RKPRTPSEAERLLERRVPRLGEVATVVEPAFGIVPTTLVAIKQAEPVGRAHRVVLRTPAGVAEARPHGAQVALGAGAVADELPRRCSGVAVHDGARLIL